MESKKKIKFAVAIACLAAVSLYLAAQHRKRRSRKQSRISCYLDTETTKPQYGFKRILADNSYSSFKHLSLKDSNNEKSCNSHPYESEIMALLENPHIDFGLFRGNMKTEMSGSFVWVETESQLKVLVDLLNKEDVFAVDTEQHSLRSFLGFTALIQISTHKEDYLVDTIALHDFISMLRPVFADPCVCKVFHGADNDVLWLQRDFHIYIVNLFDTAKACEVLSKPQKSLAYLLETYCGVTTNKLFQREDWRQRPLPLEMIEYAQTDAHYLLNIASCLIDELTEKVLENSACQDDRFHFLLEASRRSNTTCLQLYVKDDEAFPGEAAASSLLSRYLPGQGIVLSKFSGAQFQDLVMKLCAWRDIMARVHDESLRFVLSDQAIIALADKIPGTETEIYDIISHADKSMECSTSFLFLPSPSPVICSHLGDLYTLLNGNLSNCEDILQLILQRCLGSCGTCPLSIYNYSLLSKSSLKLTSKPFPKQNGVKNAKQVGRKASRELFVKKFSCKAPVYHNCRIYASDGRLLCYCDRRKLEWYLHRKLAKLVEENPPAIMLLFEPKGRPEDEDNDFYIQSKKNMCVGCGEKNHYLRYRIIPSCYRMHFPEHLKSHRSHDIVLLCVDCHEVAHAAAEKYKRQIAAEFGIPLFVRKVADPGQSQVKSEIPSSVMLDEGVSPLQLRTAAMALLRHGPRMPSKRRQELIEIVKLYYGGREVSQEDLERALLVGMSPHERRKLEKKKGLHLKYSEARILPDKDQMNPADNTISALHDSLKLDTVDELDNVNGQEVSTLEGDGRVKQMETNMKEPILSSQLEDKWESCPDDGMVVSLAKGGVSEKGGLFLYNDSNGESMHELIGTVDPCSISDQTASTNHKSKVSLLGHGPHGKQVVDYLIEEYGEEGIHQFCQRWRQVFVDAVHPQYLPAGWDVRHSGRRDFGEFSVYNPAKKASAAFQGQPNFIEGPA
ncbi:Protein RRP6-like 3, variant 2 [Ancistrocladus abbreviatus]